MRTTQQFSITVPNEMAEMIRAKVASGEYASESEVVREGLRSLMARERALERWLREEVVLAIREHDIDPASAIPAEDMHAAIVAHRQSKSRQA